jgi:hypothetical protein
MNRACARTIGPRILTSRYDDASARCSASNRPDQHNGSYPFTPSSKTLSMSSAISHPVALSAPSERKPSGRGEPLPRLESGLVFFNLRATKFSSCDSAVRTVHLKAPAQVRHLGAKPLDLARLRHDQGFDFGRKTHPIVESQSDTRCLPLFCLTAKSFANRNNRTQPRLTSYRVAEK